MTSGDMLSFGHLRVANLTLWEERSRSIDVLRPDEYHLQLALTVNELGALLDQIRAIAAGAARQPSQPTAGEIREAAMDKVAQILLELDLLSARLHMNLGDAAIKRFNACAAKINVPIGL